MRIVDQNWPVLSPNTCPLHRGDGGVFSAPLWQEKPLTSSCTSGESSERLRAPGACKHPSHPLPLALRPSFSSLAGLNSLPMRPAVAFRFMTPPEAATRTMRLGQSWKTRSRLGTRTGRPWRRPRHLAPSHEAKMPSEPIQLASEILMALDLRT